MDPLKEIGRKQKAMDKGAYQDALNKPIDAIQQSTPYRLADLIMNGEDADIGMAESLIPTVSLQRKLEQGKLPGLADIMDIPNPLSAMAPIGYGLKELRAGARLGKTLRNIEKAKEARDFVHRIHRTHVKDANSIEDKGLLVGKDNPNYSRNTGDTHLYPPSVWMGVDPTNVPVMQHYFTQQGDKGIDKTRTFSIRIPRDVYNKRQRVKWEGGRSGIPVVVSGKENPSLSPETARWTGNQAKIDMMVGSIPKEWLSKIPQKKIHELADKRLARENLEEEIKRFYGTSDIPRRILDNKRLELTSGDRLANKLDFEARNANAESNLADAIDLVTRESKKPDYFGVGDVDHEGGLTPYGILSDALGRLGDNFVGGKPIPYGTQAYDIISGKVKPEGGIRASDIIPSSGAVTKGLMNPGEISPKDRLFDWDKYNKTMEFLGSPKLATLSAQPRYRMNPDVAVMYTLAPRVLPALGSISKMVDAGNKPISWIGRFNDMSEILDDAAMRPALSHQFERMFGNNPQNLIDFQPFPDKSKVLEMIGQSKSPKLSKLRDLNPEFKTKPGAIARGNVEFTPDPLQKYYKDFLDEELSDDFLWADPDDPNDEKRIMQNAKREAGDRLRALMQDNAAYTGEFDRSTRANLINPFKHLRDVSTPK